MSEPAVRVIRIFVPKWYERRRLRGTRLDKLLDVAMEDEIQEPLPAALQATQTQAFTDWFAQPPSTWTPATDN